MFCGKCGREINDNTKFCMFCGASVDKEDDILPIDTNMQFTENTYSKIFVEPDEKYVGSLGNGYLNSFLSANAIKKCASILTDKRVYLRGNMLDVNSGKMERVNMQKTIDLEDITGTGFVYKSPQIWKLITMIALPIIFFILVEAVDDDLFVVFPIFAIVLILFLVSYLKNRKTEFFIEYAGGCIKFDASIYGLAESQDYEKQIRRAKNNVKKCITNKGDILNV